MESRALPSWPLMDGRTKLGQAGPLPPPCGPAHLLQLWIGVEVGMGLGRSRSLGLEGYCSPSWLIELWLCVCPLSPSPWYLAVHVLCSCQELCYLSGAWGFLPPANCVPSPAVLWLSSPWIFTPPPGFLPHNDISPWLLKHSLEIKYS